MILTAQQATDTQKARCSQLYTARLKFWQMSYNQGLTERSRGEDGAGYFGVMVGECGDLGVVVGSGVVGSELA